jgi:hypothetical protein
MIAGMNLAEMRDNQWAIGWDWACKVGFQFESGFCCCFIAVPVCAENSDSAILVMKAAKNWS